MNIQINFDTEHESPVFVKSIFSALADYSTETAEQISQAETVLHREPYARKPKRVPKNTPPADLSESETLAQKIESVIEQHSPTRAEVAATLTPVTIEQVRAAMHPKIIAGKQTEVAAILKKFNAEGATNVDAKDRAAFIKEINTIVV